MATKEPTEAASPAPAPAPVADAAPKVSVERLIQESADFLGIPPHMATGALHGQAKALTVDEAKSRVQTWLNKPVETEEAH